MKTKKEIYAEYLKSQKWYDIRQRLFDLVGKRCNRCGGDKSIEVHHNTYKNIFREKLEDLEVLCHACHTAHHTRKIKTKKSEQGWVALLKRRIVRKRAEDKLHPKRKKDSNRNKRFAIYEQVLRENGHYI